MNKKKKLVSSPSMTEQYFVGNNLFGEWGSMQMTVMSEDLRLNSKYIKMGREEGVFKLYSHSYQNEKFLLTTMLTIKILFTINSLKKKKKTIHSITLFTIPVDLKST